MSRTIVLQWFVERIAIIRDDFRRFAIQFEAFDINLTQVPKIAKLMLQFFFNVVNVERMMFVAQIITTAYT